jgi:hypothetical protein
MWFGVSLLSRGETPGRKEEDLLWEETIVLVQAASHDEARLLAEKIGKDSEVEYESASGERIRWTFRSVFDMYELPEEGILGPGTEVFCRFLRQSQVQSLTTPLYQVETDSEEEAKGNEHG